MVLQIFGSCSYCPLRDYCSRVLECSVTRVLGLNSRFEEAKSRTAKNEGSDEL
ncbi:hypothetical protein SLEP1_g24409 [Rubroshorea leprosula]|uniref:Uncharacterized protein n=1 Tax=Rubroshorea leprosula TaxID=152421 RepID=A0AAV5JMY2_9ROSI|nr:hypothetical protein SLEP1_g24409 [Rubroshorea leprosula]